MLKSLLPFQEVRQLAKTDIAYAKGDPALRPFYAYEPRLESFTAAITDRQDRTYPRADLKTVFLKQYSAFEKSALVSANMEALGHEDTYTIVTAHQPSLFLGPLYFLYKAITAINLAKTASATTGKHIVPVFVLGSEDHDLEELNNINLFNKKLVWQPGLAGPVGPMPGSSMEKVLAELREVLGESESAKVVYERVSSAFSPNRTFAEANQALLNDLFGKFGLLVLNMSDPLLKRHFVPVIKAEILDQVAQPLVMRDIDGLNARGFKTQATPREINFFYLSPGSRERIVLENGIYKVLNSQVTFSKETMLEEIENHPERFSPNVVLRPLYQEMVLPNLAYVGGGGELAYWLERKSLFEYFKTPFPILIRRHSVMWVDRDSVKKKAKFNLHAADLFREKDTLVREYVAANAEAEVSLSAEMHEVDVIFEKLAKKAANIDPTFEKAVLAEAVKYRSGLEQWQSRLMRAEKQKHEVALQQIRNLIDKFCPAGGLQERYDNFLPYLLKYGDGFVETLVSRLQSFDNGFVVLEDLGEVVS